MNASETRKIIRQWAPEIRQQYLGERLGRALLSVSAACDAREAADLAGAMAEFWSALVDAPIGARRNALASVQDALHEALQQTV